MVGLECKALLGWDFRGCFGTCPIFSKQKEQYISRVNLNDAADDDDESTSAEQSSIDASSVR